MLRSVPAFMRVGELGRKRSDRSMAAKPSAAAGAAPGRNTSSAAATLRATRSIISPVDSTTRWRSSRRR